MDRDRDIDWISAELSGAVAERAPAHLRCEIDAMSQRVRRPVPSRRVLIGATGLVAVLVIGLGLVLGLPGGSPAGPTVAQVAAVGAEPISYAPPPHNASTPHQTTQYARFAQVRFPGGLGIWNFEGWRIARLDGRRILTIYYAHGDDEISYSVAATPALAGQKSGFSAFRLGARTVVSWRESDHSCLLSSTSLPRAMLLATAHS
jgi:hypothetical protein